MKQLIWILLGIIAVETLAIVGIYQECGCVVGKEMSLKDAVNDYIKNIFPLYLGKNITEIKIKDLKVERMRDIEKININAYIKAENEKYNVKFVLFKIGNEITPVVYYNKTLLYFRPKFERIYEAPKKDVPEIYLFVMSFCPFGNMAEERILPFILKIKDKIKFRPVYIVSKVCKNETLDCYTSLHGKEELLEDVREICVLKEYGFEKYVDFVLKINKECNLYNLSVCWKNVAKEVGIDIEKIERCVKEKGVKYLEEDYNLTVKYQVYGSPTIIVNGERIEGLVSEETYKRFICSGFKEKPPEC